MMPSARCSPGGRSGLLRALTRSPLGASSWGLLLVNLAPLRAGALGAYSVPVGTSTTCRRPRVALIVPVFVLIGAGLTSCRLLKVTEFTARSYVRSRHIESLIQWFWPRIRDTRRRTEPLAADRACSSRARVAACLTAVALALATWAWLRSPMSAGAAASAEVAIAGEFGESPAPRVVLSGVATATRRRRSLHRADLDARAAQIWCGWASCSPCHHRGLRSGGRAARGLLMVQRSLGTMAVATANDWAPARVVSILIPCSCCDGAA